MSEIKEEASENDTPNLDVENGSTGVGVKRDADTVLTEETVKKPRITQSKNSEENEFANHDSTEHNIKSGIDGDKSALLVAPKRKLIDLMYVERHSNGSGLALHAYQEELVRLDMDLVEKFVDKFFHNLFKERPGRGHGSYCLGVVHGAAKDWPDLVTYMAECHSQLMVKVAHLERKHEVESMTCAAYAQKVKEGFKNGTMRTGPMNSVSLVGTKGEEIGEFMPDLIRKLERCPFLKRTTPWGSLSRLRDMDPKLSNDGPILWHRPGEQAVTSTSGGRRGGGDGLQQMYSSGGGIRGVRQTVVTDRTHVHADHADDGFDRHTTAAVGLLRAVRPSRDARVVKDAIFFDPRHYQQLIMRLQLDIMEPPASQCPNLWMEDAELNLLRREGYKYTRQALKDKDIYFIPRGVVHQFKTVSATSSIAWHVRLAAYYPESQPQSKSKSKTESSSE